MSTRRKKERKGLQKEMMRDLEAVEEIVEEGLVDLREIYEEELRELEGAEEREEKEEEQEGKG